MTIILILDFADYQKCLQAFYLNQAILTLNLLSTLPRYWQHPLQVQLEPHAFVISAHYSSFFDRFACYHRNHRLRSRPTASLQQHSFSFD